MNINFNNIDIGTKAFGVGEQAAVESQKIDGGQVASQGLKFSGVQSVDVLVGSEPVVDVPTGELVRDDALGNLVSSAFNLPPPPMPNFQASGL